jgi:hypothetical protein
MAKKKRKARAPRAGSSWRRMIRYCSAETVQWLNSLGLTAGQRSRIARAVDLTRRNALRRGDVIGPEEALGEIARVWQQDHPA